MTKLAFVTDTVIDIKSFTVFGMNAKPNSRSPIGFFGTGLKISIAVLCRLGCKVSVYIDGVEHEFYTKTTSFRGKEFGVVRMKKRKGVLSNWQYQEMPYTTELGKNWEPWQVYRELESNTRDEGGSTYLLDDLYSFKEEDLSGKTIIVVEEPEVVKCYNDRDEIFHPEAQRESISGEEVQIIEGSSRFIYYRGMRVLSLYKPSHLTYNIVSEQRLTEDRTLYNHDALAVIKNFIMESEDRGLLNRIAGLSKDVWWEGFIDFDMSYFTASPTFFNVIQTREKKGKPVLPRMALYYENNSPEAREDPKMEVTLRKSVWMSLMRELQMSVKGPEAHQFCGILTEKFGS